MKPAPFEYVDPNTVAEAVSLLKEYDGDAKVLAGGQSLMPLLNMRLARPAVLVDVGKIAGLDHIEDAGGCIAIGALTTQRTVERSDVVRERLPLLHRAVRFIAHPQIRNRGTFGGSVAHADPAAECPALMLALDAELKVVGPDGERKIAAADFFVTYLTTTLGPADVLTEIRLPAQSNDGGWSFMEIARRQGDFALAGIAVTLRLEASGQCGDARVVLFGVGSTPIRSGEAERAVVGRRPDARVFTEAARTAAAALEEPLTDVHASSEYRRHLAEVLTRRALTEAAARAGGKTGGKK